MKELLEQIKLNPEESFYIGVFQDHIDQSAWHYHQEFELSFITEGTGKRIVGDSVEAFYPGDLIFIGPGIPHVWFSESPVQKQHSGRTLESVYLLFNHHILPEGLTVLPEFRAVNRAIRYSERGIRITGDTLNQVSRLMLQLPYLNTLKRLMLFYEIMDMIGNSDTFTYLASADYVRTRFQTSNSRVKKIHEFLMKNYREEVTLQQIAGVAHMAPASVSRFFKGATGLSVFEYLNKIKIDFARQLLLNTDMSVEHISYDCGFNNLSHFNKQFKKFSGWTPSKYRKLRNQ
ncbi:MAG: helix-turn-helix domain-containing protein [Bacteroidales bacterium]